MDIISLSLSRLLDYYIMSLAMTINFRNIIGRIVKRHNHFVTLGLSRDASQKDIKTSFYKKAKRLHPDVAELPLEEANKRFIELKTAYDVLSNPDSRLQYIIELNRQSIHYENHESYKHEHYKHNHNNNHRDDEHNHINNHRDDDFRSTFRRRRRKVKGDITMYKNNWDDFKKELQEAIDKAYYGPVFIKDDINEYPENFEVEIKKELILNKNYDNEICHVVSGRQKLGEIYIPSKLELSATVAEMLSLSTTLLDENIDNTTICEVLHLNYSNNLHARATRKLNTESSHYTILFERFDKGHTAEYLGKILKADKFDILFNHSNDETHRIVNHYQPGVNNYYWHSKSSFVELKMSKAYLPPVSLWYFEPRDSDFIQSWYFETNKNGQYSRKFRNNNQKIDNTNISIDNYDDKQHLDISLAILYCAFKELDSLKIR